jgi:hypothetical protein
MWRLWQECMAIQPNTITTNGCSTTYPNLIPFHLVKHEVVETATCSEDLFVYRDVMVIQTIIQHLPSLFKIPKVHSMSFQMLSRLVKKHPLIVFFPTLA